MIISSHLNKIKQLDVGMALLDPLEDFELWFWSVMVAGTNAVNAALHLAKVTPSESAYPSQPGVYYVPGAQGNKLILKEFGDVLHVGRPPIKKEVPPDILKMMEAMERIEKFRDPCTRGDTEPNTEIISQCELAYRECIDLLQIRLLDNQT
jgi:hypothetical protein